MKGNKWFIYMKKTTASVSQVWEDFKELRNNFAYFHSITSDEVVYRCHISVQPREEGQQLYRIYYFHIEMERLKIECLRLGSNISVNEAIRFSSVMYFKELNLYGEDGEDDDYGLDFLSDLGY